MKGDAEGNAACVRGRQLAAYAAQLRQPASDVMTTSAIQQKGSQRRTPHDD